MSFYEILLVVISGVGLLHGFFIATYLIILKGKKSLANILLAITLIAMGFRIGKSVMLNFVAHLEFQFILIGLGIILLIGPLLRWYVKAMTQPNYKLNASIYLETIPFFFVFILSFLVSENTFKKSTYGFEAFASILLITYLHFAIYIFLSWQKVNQKKKNIKIKTKAQESIISWLQMLIYGFMIIWVSYVLNILDDVIPYIIAPILYSIGVYVLSFKAYIIC